MMDYTVMTMNKGIFHIIAPTPNIAAIIVEKVHQGVVVDVYSGVL
jgi:hypothetical protein